METTSMGRVVVSAKIENLNDVINARRGTIPPDQIHFVEVADALVDTGTKFLGLPKRLIQQLDLVPFATRQAQTAAGVVPCQVYGAARLTIADRECSVDVNEVADGSPVLIGQLALESLDFIVDAKNQRLISDPWVGDQRYLDLF